MPARAREGSGANVVYPVKGHAHLAAHPIQPGNLAHAAARSPPSTTSPRQSIGTTYSSTPLGGQALGSLRLQDDRRFNGRQPSPTALRQPCLVSQRALSVRVQLRGAARGERAPETQKTPSRRQKAPIRPWGRTGSKAGRRAATVLRAPFAVRDRRRGAVCCQIWEASERRSEPPRAGSIPPLRPTRSSSRLGIGVGQVDIRGFGIRRSLWSCARSSAATRSRTIDRGRGFGVGSGGGSRCTLALRLGWCAPCLELCPATCRARAT